MNIECCFSSPDGDIMLSAQDLATPFKITPQKEHPDLTLHDYFKALETFILISRREDISKLTGKEEIEKLIIRSEKHGAFYHIASVDLIQGDKRNRFGLCTAVTEAGRDALSRELESIDCLNQEPRFSCLPQMYAGSEVVTSCSCGRPNTLLIALVEWLEGYHEWHLYQDKNGQGEQLVIWDQERGYHFASDQAAWEIFRQAAMILTLYYDFRTYRQICPWHHGAGDFVVKPGPPAEVKLTTIRGYDVLVPGGCRDSLTPLIAAVYFFLHLTVRMRLDRQEGTGEPIWAGKSFLKPVVDGFFEELLIKERDSAKILAEVKKLPNLLKSFSRGELEKLLYSLLPLYEPGDPEEYRLIAENLPAHAFELTQALGEMMQKRLQNFDLGSKSGQIESIQPDRIMPTGDPPNTQKWCLCPRKETCLNISCLILP